MEGFEDRGWDHLWKQGSGPLVVTGGSGPLAVVGVGTIGGGRGAGPLVLPGVWAIGGDGGRDH